MKTKRFEVQIEIERRPEEVGAFFADLANFRFVHPLIEHMRELSAGQNEAGQRTQSMEVTDFMYLGPLPYRFRYQVTMTATGEREASYETRPSPRVRLRNVTRWESRGSSTLVTEETQVEAPALLVGYVTRQARQAHEASFQNIKVYLETGTPLAKAG